MEGLNLELTFDLLPVFGAALVLLNVIVPKWKVWYEALESDKKQMVNVYVIAGVTLLVVALSGLEIVDVYGGETWREWVVPPVTDFVIALLANAGVYKAFSYKL